MGALATIGYSLISNLGSALMQGATPLIRIVVSASLWNLAQAIDRAYAESLSSLFSQPQHQAEQLMETGNTLLEEKAYSEALEAYQQAFELSEDPVQQVELLNRIGMAYGGLGEQQETLIFFDKALDLSKTLFQKANAFTAEIMYNRALALSNLRDYDQAYAAFIDAYEMCATLGKEALERGDNAEAIGHWEKAKIALSTPPESPIGGEAEFGNIELQRGIAHLYADQLEEASFAFYEAALHFVEHLKTDKHPIVAQINSMISLTVLLIGNNDEAAYKGFVRALKLLEESNAAQGVALQKFRGFLREVADGGIEYLQEFRSRLEIQKTKTIVEILVNPKRTSGAY